MQARTPGGRDAVTDRRKTFLLGVGCQRGGTTWLRDYLQRSDEADLGSRSVVFTLDPSAPAG